MSVPYFGQELRVISDVPRWGIVRTLGRQCVAEHSYFVAFYTSQICRFLKINTNTTIECVNYALWHDQDEAATGDIPGVAKRYILNETKYREFLQKSKDLLFGGDGPISSSEATRLIVKLADVVDECFFMAGEYRLGNVSGPEQILDRSLHILDRTITKLSAFYPKELCSSLSEVLWDEINRAVVSGPKLPVFDGE